MAITNGVIFQGFHWHTAADGMLWNGLAGEARALADAGFTAVWLPPASKASGAPCPVASFTTEISNRAAGDRGHYGRIVHLRESHSGASRTTLWIFPPAR